MNKTIMVYVKTADGALGFLKTQNMVKAFAVRDALLQQEGLSVGITEDPALIDATPIWDKERRAVAAVLEVHKAVGNDLSMVIEHEEN